MTIPKPEAPNVGDISFTSRFPFQFEESFYADLSRLHVTEQQFEIIRSVFEANNLQGTQVDAYGHLFCCVVSALGLAVLYCYAQDLKGIILIGLLEMDVSGSIDRLVDKSVLENMRVQAARLGFECSTSKMFIRLRKSLTE